MTMLGDQVLAELNDDGSRIIIISAFRDKELVKMVPGTRFDSKDKTGGPSGTWWVAKSWPVCHALRGVFGDRLAIGPKLSEWATNVAEWCNYVLNVKQSTDVKGDPREYSYQRVGSLWLRAVKRGLLADEMGTGKTVQACAALDALHQPEDYYEDRPTPGPVLIVCPNSVKRVWLRHLETWCPQLQAEIVGGRKPTAGARRKTFERLDAFELDAVIINWEALQLHSRLAGFGDIRLTDKEKTHGELNRPWRVVIADEVHRAKDPRSKQTRALWAASEEAEYRWGFTGTPIANDPADLWAILHFLSPNDWSSKTRWVDRYGIVSWNPFGGLDVVGLNPLTEPELRKTLDVHMLRRTKAEVLPFLPPVVEEQRYVTLSPKERKAYDEMAKSLVTELEDGTELVAWNPLLKLTRLLQLASASMQSDDDNEEFLLCEPSSKLDELLRLLDDIGDKPVVIAARSRQLIQLAEARLDKKGITYGSIHGEVPVAQRDDFIDAFQAGQLRCMLITTGAGSEGIDLTAADTMIFLQRPFSMVENVQTMARIDRHGQTAEKVTVIDLITEDTAEDRTFEVLFRKEGMLEEVTRDLERLKMMLSIGGKT